MIFEFVGECNITCKLLCIYTLWYQLTHAGGGVGVGVALGRFDFVPRFAIISLSPQFSGYAINLQFVGSTEKLLCLKKLLLLYHPHPLRLLK